MEDTFTDLEERIEDFLSNGSLTPEQRRYFLELGVRAKASSAQGEGPTEDQIHIHGLVSQTVLALTTLGAIGAFTFAVRNPELRLDQLPASLALATYAPAALISTRAAWQTYKEGRDTEATNLLTLAMATYGVAISAIPSFF